MVYLTKIHRKIGDNFWSIIVFLNLLLTPFPKLTLKITTFFILSVLLFGSGFATPSVSMANVKESQTGKTSKTKKKVKQSQSPKRKKTAKDNDTTNIQQISSNNRVVEQIIFQAIK